MVSSLGGLMGKTVVTEEEKRDLKALALELHEIRKLLDALAETLVKVSDKEFLKLLDAGQDGVREKQVDSYRLTLEKQLDIAEKEFRT